MPRFRFTLRTLLLAVAVLALSLGWYVHSVWRQPDLVVLTLGGKRSMEPNISGRVLFVADRNAYRSAKPARWDAVVLRPEQPPVVSVLRVIGLPGETVSYANETVLVDGQPIVPPPRLRNRTFRHRPLPGTPIPHPYTVPPGCYYLLGDNPDEADDSRAWGALPEAEIIGGVRDR